MSEFDENKFNNLKKRIDSINAELVDIEAQLGLYAQKRTALLEEVLGLYAQKRTALLEEVKTLGLPESESKKEYFKRLKDLDDWRNRALGKRKFLMKEKMPLREEYREMATTQPRSKGNDSWRDYINDTLNEILKRLDNIDQKLQDTKTDETFVTVR